jgi:hypothetical protein
MEVLWLSGDAGHLPCQQVKHTLLLPSSFETLFSSLCVHFAFFFSSTREKTSVSWEEGESFCIYEGEKPVSSFLKQ